MRSQCQMQWVVTRVALQIDLARVLGDIRRCGRDGVAAADVVLRTDVDEPKCNRR